MNLHLTLFLTLFWGGRGGEGVGPLYNFKTAHFAVTNISQNNLLIISNI